MNKYDFHIPFIKSLVIIAAVTLVSMGTANYFINKIFFPGHYTSIFTSQQSQYSSDSKE
jgi:hypothetical protein